MDSSNSNSSKKVFVVGATGASGKWTLQKLLEKGYQVTAMTRSLEKLKKSDYAPVNWVEGDPYKVESLENLFKGHHAVISCIGNGPSLKKTTVYSESIKNIIEAMEINGIHRLLYTTAAQDVHHIGFFFRNVVKKVILNCIFDDMAVAEDYIKKYNGPVKYTIVRPFRFLNEPSQGKLRAVKHEDITSSKGWDFKTRVEDIGNFMADQVFQDTWAKKFVIIGQ
jgi:putative NADH-flavin reductase